MWRLLGGVSDWSTPSTRTTPRSGHSKPAAMRSAVVFPQPLGPEEADELARLDLEVEVVERDGRPERLAHAFEGQGGHGAPQ